MRPLLLLGSLCILGGSVAAGWVYRQQQLQSGLAAYAAHDYATANTDLSQFSGWFDPAAQAALADMYLNGKGVAQNPNVAFALAQEAATGGNPQGQYLLSNFYLTGTGTSEDDAKSFTFAQQSADQGNPQAALELADLYNAGKGTKQDYAQAAYYYRRALSHGLWAADDSLGALYANGFGVPQDAVKSLSYYQEAAAHNDAVGEFHVGLAALTGTGTPPDFNAADKNLTMAAMQGNADALHTLGDIVAIGGTTTGGPLTDATQAYMFYDLAASRGSATARLSQTTLADKLTPDQISDAQLMAANWHPGTPFPPSSFEDFAAQALFDAGHSDATTLTNSGTWFSVNFPVAGHTLRAVFIKVKDPSGPHAEGANISVVLFDTAIPPSPETLSLAVDFTQAGAWGDVSPPPDLTKPADAPTRANAQAFALSPTLEAVLVPQSFTDQGDAITSYLAFVYNAQTESWIAAGGLAGGDDDTGNCGATPSPSTGCTLPGFSWTGTPTLAPAATGGLAQIIIHAKGTEPSAHDKSITPATDLIYAFDGKGFKRLSPTPAHFYEATN
jgi:TPR repeat protein